MSAPSSWRGGPLRPARLLPPLPEGPDGWLGAVPPPGPSLLALWSAGCPYCRQGLAALAPKVAALGLPLVALHVPELADDEANGAAAAQLASLGLSPDDRMRFAHADARAFATEVGQREWPTFLVVDAARKATFVLVGFAGPDDPLVGALLAALAEVRSNDRPAP